MTRKAIAFTKVGVNPRIDWIARSIHAPQTQCAQCQVCCWVHPSYTPSQLRELEHLCNDCAAKEAARTLQAGRPILVVEGDATPEIIGANKNYQQRN